MQIRRDIAGGILVLGIGTLLNAQSVPAVAQRTRTPERALLGIRLMDRYSDVLRKFGPPNDIQVGYPGTVPGDQPAAGAGGRALAGAGGAGRMGGMMGGSGMMGSGMMGGGGKMSGMMGGAMGGPPGIMTGGGMSGSGGPPAGMMAAMMRGGPLNGGGGSSLPGFAGGGGMRMPGMPGSIGGGAARMPGMPGNIGGGNAGAAGGADTEPEDTAIREATWWYHIKSPKVKGKPDKPTTHYAFLFNRDGRVIQIQQFGYKSNGRTQRGVGLGDNLSKIIHAYGFNNDSERVGDNLMLRYKAGGTVAFQLVKNQVVGITLAVVR